MSTNKRQHIEYNDCLQWINEYLVDVNAARALVRANG